MEELAAGLVDALVGVGAEVVALGLEQVGRQAFAAMQSKNARAVLNAGTGMPFLTAVATTLRQERVQPLMAFLKNGLSSRFSSFGFLSNAFLILPRNTLRMMQPPRHISAMPP